jgi:hypothetical protein
MSKRREMGIEASKKALIGSHCDGSQLSSRPRTPIPWRDFTVTDGVSLVFGEHKWTMMISAVGQPFMDDHLYPLPSFLAQQVR